MNTQQSREELLKSVPDGNNNAQQIEQATASVLSLHQRRTTIVVDMNGYSGEFVLKYPSLKDKMDIGILRSKLTGGVPTQQLDVVTDNIAYMAATLIIVTVSAPDWFDIEIMEDYNVLDYIFTEYTKWTNSFRRTNKPSDNEESSRAW